MANRENEPVPCPDCQGRGFTGYLQRAGGGGEYEDECSTCNGDGTLRG